MSSSGGGMELGGPSGGMELGGPSEVDLLYGTIIVLIHNYRMYVASDSRECNVDNILHNSRTKVQHICQHFLFAPMGSISRSTEGLQILKEETQKYQKHSNQICPLLVAANKISHLAAEGKLRAFVVGYDHYDGMASIYIIDRTGVNKTNNAMSIGSGGSFSQYILDNEYREDMSVEEVTALMQRALIWAAINDYYTGGKITVNRLNSLGEVVKNNLTIDESKTRPENEKARSELKKEWNRGKFNLDCLVQNIR